MRLHRSLVHASIDALKHISNDGQYADKVVAQVLKRDKRWGSHDRKFVAETVYELVRWKRLYAEIAEVREPFAVPDIWRMFAVWATLRGIALPDWPEFKGTPVRRIKGRFDELSKTRAIRESIPDWMDQLGLAELGEADWTRELKALNQQADLILRVNTLKTTRKQLIDRMWQEHEWQAEALDGYPDAVRMVQRANVFQTQIFKDGWFEVQDASSQRVAPLLDVHPGMRVIDACAGAGGKTLHLASMMDNKGQITAMDIHGFKLDQLKLRARRNGIHNIQCQPIEGTKSIKKWKEKADRILIDAPCSGLGVLKRNPDSKWKLQPEFIDQIRRTQAEILEQYASMLKPGGKMVYATCSILPSENQEQVARFLTTEAGKAFQLVEEHPISPSVSGFDGFYMALLYKNPNI